MKTIRTRFLRWPVTALFILTAACGGGGNPTAGIDAGGVRAPVATSAGITGFGSVIVDGTRYDTAGATVLINGVPASETDLAAGQQVRIAGTLESGGTAAASSVELDLAVVGPIDEIDTDGHRLVVLGQEVRVDAATSFATDYAPGTLEGLSPGDAVAISGLSDSSGRLFATRIEPAGSTEHRIMGQVTTVEEAQFLLTVGALVIDFSAAMIEGFADGRPAAGDTIAAVGEHSGPGTEFAASRLSYVPPPEPAADEELRVTQEGFVTRFAGPEDFDVAGRAFAVGADAVFVNGAAADLVLDARVIASGTVAAGSEVVVASEIRFRRPGIFRLEAPLDAVDAAGGTLRAAGITIRIRPQTRIEDQSEQALRTLAPSGLQVGDFVDVRGYEADDGIVATRIEREDDEDDAEVELTGIVREPMEPEFVIAGVTVVTGPDTEFDDLDRDELFSGGDGWLVSVEGEFDGTSIVAEEVEAADDAGGDTELD